MKPNDFKKQKEVLSSMVEMKPSFHLSSKDLPELKKWKVGKEYDLSLHVRQKGMHEMGKEMCADFEVLSVKECESDD